MVKIRKILIISIVFLIFIIICPWAYANDSYSLTVKDKRIEHNYLDTYYYLDTVEFGELKVDYMVYNRVWINDNITVVEGLFNDFNVIKINNESIEEPF